MSNPHSEYMRRRKRPNLWVLWSNRFFWLVFTLFALSVLIVVPLRWLDPPTTAFMLADESERRPLLFTWQTWDELGVAPVLAVVAAEDQRFADHFGLDIESIQQSLEQAEQGGRLRGASTISQQLVKNLYLWSGRSFIRKGLEAYLTLLLEACLSKKRILELYLNIVELGPGVYGFPAAAQHFFDRDTDNLDFEQAALLAAVLPNPKELRANQPSSYLRQRQKWILGHMQRMHREGWLGNLNTLAD